MTKESLECFHNDDNSFRLTKFGITYIYDTMVVRLKRVTKTEKTQFEICLNRSVINIYVLSCNVNKIFQIYLPNSRQIIIYVFQCI